MSALVLLHPAACAAAGPADAGVEAFRSGRFAEAVLDWERGAGEGDARSTFLLGSAYDTGSGVPQDEAAAARLYGRAGEMGDPSGALDAGLMADAGRGVPRDAAAAARWYRTAAGLGSGRAAFDLGLILQDGDDGVPADRPGAAAMFRLAAGLGVPEALRRLSPTGYGRAVPHPFPVPGDAARAAFERAQVALLSSGGQASPALVAGLRTAAAAGDGAAAYDLAYCFERGLGVPPDRGQALAWYGRAAASRDPRLSALASAAGTRLSAQQPSR